MLCKQVDKDSLHIWPRGSHFLMGLSNLDGSFTMTLYMHEKSSKEGEVSFDQLKTREQVDAFFAEYYPTAVSVYLLYIDVLLHPHLPLSLFSRYRGCVSPQLLLLVVFLAFSCAIFLFWGINITRLSPHSPPSLNFRVYFLCSFFFNI